MEFEMETMFDESLNRWDVTINGEIDIFESNEFKEKLIELIEQKETDLYIRCGNLSYIDSTGLGALVAVLKSVKIYGGEMKLIGLKPAIAKLFRITNLDKAFVVEGDIGE